VAPCSASVDAFSEVEVFAVFQTRMTWFCICFAIGAAVGVGFVGAPSGPIPPGLVPSLLT
jgi:hypothetical protein